MIVISKMSFFQGTLNLEELTDIVITFYDFEDEDRQMAVRKAENIFHKLDSNSDGSLDEEEFCEGCIKDDDFYKVLNEGVQKLFSDSSRVE